MKSPTAQMPARCRQPSEMYTWEEIENQQKEICKRLTVSWHPIKLGSLVAFNPSLFSELQPINGLRHPKEERIDSWYLWSGGEIDQTDPNYFKPIHVDHLQEGKPMLLKYLGLPPGWRFQIDNNGYEDIWFDISLLEI